MMVDSGSQTERRCQNGAYLVYIKRSMNREVRSARGIGGGAETGFDHQSLREKERQVAG